MSTITTEAQYTSGVYGKRDVVIVRGRGARVWDESGREYIDCVAGIGVANVGHCHPTVVSALQRQAQTLITCPELLYNDRRAQYLERLVPHLPAELERLYLCNSGAEAVEAALKFARLSTGRTGVVAAMRGFHGRTYGALSATHRRKYRQSFAPLVPGFDHVPFDNVQRLADAVDEDTAAVILEIVQGESGVRPGAPAYFREAQRLCRQRGALLIVDEVQTGFGRTGRWFACGHAGISPDLLCLGKAIAGGIPMGAVAIGPRVCQLAPGQHGSTFGGNPLACAAALATLDVMEEEELPRRAADVGQSLLQRLQAIDSPLVREVRGPGLMIGIELKTYAMPLAQALTERGVLAPTAGSTVLRLLPPLVIEEEDLETVTTALEEALAEVAEDVQLGAAG